MSIVCVADKETIDFHWIILCLHFFFITFCKWSSVHPHNQHFKYRKFIQKQTVKWTFSFLFIGIFEICKWKKNNSFSSLSIVLCFFVQSENKQNIDFAWMIIIIKHWSWCTAYKVKIESRFRQRNLLSENYHDWGWDLKE